MHANHVCMTLFLFIIIILPHIAGIFHRIKFSRIGYNWNYSQVEFLRNAVICYGRHMRSPTITFIHRFIFSQKKVNQAFSRAASILVSHSCFYRHNKSGRGRRHYGAPCQKAASIQGSVMGVACTSHLIIRHVSAQGWNFKFLPLNIGQRVTVINQFVPNF